MQDDDRLYGLIAQAEDIQKHAVTLHRAAQEAIKGLPEGYREAIRGSTREMLTEASQKASRGLLDASNEAKATCSLLRRTGLMQGVFLVAVAIVIAGGTVGGMHLVGKSWMGELAELKTAIRQEQATLNELHSETWGLTLVNYNDGTRGIILPKGIKVDRTGTVSDGRNAVVIKP